MKSNFQFCFKCFKVQLVVHHKDDWDEEANPERFQVRWYSDCFGRREKESVVKENGSAFVGGGGGGGVHAPCVVCSSSPDCEATIVAIRKQQTHNIAAADEMNLMILIPCYNPNCFNPLFSQQLFPNEYNRKKGSDPTKAQRIQKK